MISFEQSKNRRRPNLTPMIDVVFLLLVFFMLVSRFGVDQALPLSLSGSGDAYRGEPRLVEFSKEGVSLNGQVLSVEEVLPALDGLTETPKDAIILRAKDEADMQNLVSLMGRLQSAGYTRLILVE